MNSTVWSIFNKKDRWKVRFVSTVIEKLLKSLSKGTRKVAEVALFTPFQSKTTAQREKKKKEGKGETRFAKT